MKKIAKKAPSGAKSAQEPGLIAYRFFDEKNEFGKQSHLHQILRDQKKGWENLTGVSSITKVIAKPLTWWAAGETLKVLGWSNAKIRVDGRYQNVDIKARLARLKPVWKAMKKMDDLAIIKLFDTAYKAHDSALDKTAEAGIDLHDELEKYVKAAMQIGIKKMKKEDWKFFDNEKIWNFHLFSKATFKRFIWSEIYSRDIDLWVGGQSDAGVETLAGNYGVIDFKSHEEPYFSDWVQCGGYDLIISKNGGFNKKGERVMEPLDKPITEYYVIPFKAPNFVGKIGVNKNVEDLKKAFLASATLYREKSKYDKY